MEIGRDAHGIKSLSRHTLEQIVALSADGILLVDAGNPRLPIVYANAAYEDLSGHSASELAGQGWSLVGREESEPELQRLKASIDRSEPCRVTVPEVRKDGTAWLAQVSVEPLRNARGELKYFLCIHRPAGAAATGAFFGAGSAPPESGEATGELSPSQRDVGPARQRLAALDRVDPATGLLRLGYFKETLCRDLAIARRDQRFVTLLVFAIVELDVYRQTFGTKAADTCQRMIGAQIMRTLRRAGDLCARYDDSTLVAAVLGQAPDEVRHLTEQIADNVRRLGLHNPRAKLSRHITVHSATVGCPPGTLHDPDAVLARALEELRGGNDAARAALS